MKDPKHLSSADNPLIKRLNVLLEGGVKANKTRQELGLAVLEGVHLAQAWLGSEDLVELFTTESGLQQAEIAAVIDMQLAVVPNTDLYILDDALWKKISDLENAPPIMACVKIPNYTFPLTQREDVLILDGIQDAGNVGSMMRTAAAAGLSYVVCLKGTAQAWSPKVLRAAMGAHRHLKIFEAWTLNMVREKIKLPLIATSLIADQDLYDLGDELLDPHAWIFGNEGGGVNPELLAISRSVQIPQDPCIESLNVGAAAAVCLFETRRVRRELK
jgi:TrmH family RNA methyltransferase